MDDLAKTNVKPWILPVIVFSQFCCTSVWFASNGVMVQLLEQNNLTQSALGHLTSAVQLGFITGTLIFAFFTIADRMSPAKVFVISACFASVFNLAITWEDQSLSTLLLYRFLTGFFLAGIYPVGMKIASDYYQRGLGKSLGYLVGALVLGTASPHLARNLVGELQWELVIYSTSAVSILGGFVLFIFVPNGPFRKAGQKLDLSAVFRIFRNRDLRAAALGYFGHMWELYAFWAFIPVMVTYYNNIHDTSGFNIPLIAFLVIASGGVSCIIGGHLSQRFGPKVVAATALSLSGLCCLLSPLGFLLNGPLFICFLIFWGLMVTADSPLFSTLVAGSAQPELRGTALTIVNCIGFTITIIGIQVINLLQAYSSQSTLYMLLAVGPILGLWGFLKEDLVKSGSLPKSVE